MLIWSLLSTGRLQMKSSCIYCETLNLIFSKTNFGPTGVYVLSSISRTLHNFSTGFFSMYREISELKNDPSILCKSGPFANKTCCSLTALFVKTKIYFCLCNFANKHIKKNSQYRFFVQTIVNRQNLKYSGKCLQFCKWNPKSTGTY